MKKNKPHKDQGLRLAIQCRNETTEKMTLSEDFADNLMQRIHQQDKKPRHRRVRFWTWVAAACVTAFLAVLLGPPREETITKPQIAKVEPRKKAVEAEATEPKEQDLSPTTAQPQPPRRTKRKAYASKRITKEAQETRIEQEVGTISETNDLAVVEESDMIPFEDQQMKFAEQARILRERGNRVIQRVAMNGLPSNNYQLNEQ